MKSISRCARMALAAAFVLGLMALPSSAAEDIKPEQTKAVEKIVRDYLIQNPEIIVEALEAYKKKQKQAEADATRRTLAERKAELRRDPGSPVGGDPSGDVALIEFFDYRCGVCKRVHPIVAELMRTDKKIRRVYKEWPILGSDSVFAARAALASRRQGKYFVFHNAMMEAKRSLTPAVVFTIAAKVGLNVKRLKRDIESPEIDAILKRNFALADALKLTGTPSFVIGDELLRGGRDLQTLRRIIDRQRKAS